MQYQTKLIYHLDANDTPGLTCHLIWTHHHVCIKSFIFPQEILDAIEKNQVVVISGETGCGKTTQVPAEIFSNRMSMELALVACPTGGQKVAGSIPALVRYHSFVEINQEIFSDHEIFSTVILSLLLIYEGQLSVSGERMCTILVNWLED